MSRAAGENSDGQRRKSGEPEQIEHHLPAADPDALVAVVLDEERRRQAAQQERARAESEALPRQQSGVNGTSEAVSLRTVALGASGTLGVLCAFPFIATLHGATFWVLAPDIQHALGLTTLRVGVIGALGALVAAATAIPFGWFGDRRPRFPIVGVAALAIGAGSAIAGTARSTGLIVAAMILIGLARGSEGPLQWSLVADAVPMEARHQAYGLTRLAHGLGFVLGPAILGVIATAGGQSAWRWALMLVAAGFVGVGFAAFRIREPRPGRQEMLAVLEGEIPEERDQRIIPARAALRRVRRIGTFNGIIAGAAVIGTNLIAVPIFGGVFLQRHYGLGATGRGVVMSLAGLGMITGATLGGRLYPRTPVATVRLAATAVAASGLLASLSFLMPNAPLFAFAAIASGACTMFGSVGIQATMAAVLPYRLRATGAGLVATYQALIGGFVGAIAIGQIESASTLRTGLALVCAFAALAGGAFLAHGSTRVARDIASASADVVEEVEEHRRIAGGTSTSLLQVRNLDFSYGPVQVLFDVNLDVREGEVLALLGTNGAGKSTVLRAVTGLSQIDRGVIRLGGKDITFADPAERLGLGIVQVPGGHATFASLSVLDNLRARGFSVRRRGLDARIERALARFPVLSQRLDQPAGSLSGGEQQMLAIAGALLLEPQVLLIDELSLGLAPIVVQQLLETVAALKQDGMTMVIVEQSVNVALSMADRAVFMEKGQVRFEGPAHELLERDDLVRAVFLGGVGG
jgi:ABC-type branched-subunit amino acid transport system ATPase component/predicted MFS family arabinose efflux permease